MTLVRIGAGAAVVVGLAACAVLPTGRTIGATATAELQNGEGRAVGTALLTQINAGVRIVVEVRGLSPGTKAVHIHETGRCEAPAFSSAGGHFNPDGRQHGLLNPRGPHAGDLPNITIEADGAGRLETTTDRITLGAGSTSLFDGDGSAIVVHGSQDDFMTDPTGNSGARIACGVIVKQEPQ
jgi:superoxide dismutase, Cu-Zn family